MPDWTDCGGWPRGVKRIRPVKMRRSKIRMGIPRVVYNVDQLNSLERRKGNKVRRLKLTSIARLRR